MSTPKENDVRGALGYLRDLDFRILSVGDGFQVRGNVTVPLSQSRLMTEQQLVKEAEKWGYSPKEEDEGGAL